ncbi:MAG: DEAD/DEAH box helicase, partial [Bradyrhizobium sp.]
MPRMSTASVTETAALLPGRFQEWFAARGWLPREHQLALLSKARHGRSALLIAPTGAGKTLAGFLPSLVELSGSPSLAPLGERAATNLLHMQGGERKSFVSTGRGVKHSRGLHTLYISPLKA